MKKILVIAAIALMLIPVTAMAGMTAFMDMDEMSSNEMSDVTGQTGITIDSQVNITGGYIAWGDDDGCTTYTVQGYVQLTTIVFDMLDIDDMTIDACYDGTDTWIVITMNEQTINGSIAAIRTTDSLGFGAGASMGSLTIGSLTMDIPLTRIRGH